MNAMPAPQEEGSEPVGSGARSSSELVDRLASLLSQYQEAVDAGLKSDVQWTRSAPGSTSNTGSLGRARKVSVSLPEELTSAVQRRAGRGAFSQYVTDAVARQLELDLLGELIDILEAEYGPVSEEMLAEASASWPDVE